MRLLPLFFLVPLVACSHSDALSVDASAFGSDVGWRTVAPTEALVPGQVATFTVQVPPGSSYLDADVTVASGDARITVIGVGSTSVCGSTCRVDNPLAGTWTVELTSSGGAEGIVLSWEIGGADDQPVELLRRDFHYIETVDVWLPDALGTLELWVTGGADRRAEIVDHCTDEEQGIEAMAGCLVRFPPPGAYSLVAFGNTSLMGADWRPAPHLLDVHKRSGPRSFPIEIHEGTEVIELRAQGHVRFMQGAFSFCQGEERCRIDQPIPGSYQAYVDGPEGRVRVATLGDAPPNYVPPSVSIVGTGDFPQFHHAGEQTAFVFDGDVELEVRSAGRMDLQVEVFDADGALVQQDDDSGDGLNFAVHVAPGESIVVSHISNFPFGPWTLNVGPRVARPSDLVINEFAVNAREDFNCDGVQDDDADEFIELVNTGPGELELEGLSLSDAVLTRHVFGPGLLAAGHAVVVYGGGTPACSLPGTDVVVASTGLLGLSGADTVWLDDRDGQALQSHSYQAPPEDGSSFTRDGELDASTPFVSHLERWETLATPGTRGDGSSFGGAQ